MQRIVFLAGRALPAALQFSTVSLKMGSSLIVERHQRYIVTLEIARFAHTLPKILQAFARESVNPPLLLGRRTFVAKVRNVAGTAGLS